MVYVISKNNKVLQPTNRYGKVRRLLKDKKAKIVSKNPFTIQLLYDTTDFTQKIVLGIDLGYKNIGFAFVSNNKVLEKGEIELRDGVTELLQRRKTYRGSRRNRKTRYRPARWQNRVRTKKKGWLPPSIQNKYDHIIRWIDRFTKYLNDYLIRIEIANFDIQKINNPDIEGTEYQQGNLYNYENLKSYLIARENGKCQLCGKEKGDDSWHLHHITQRKNGGTDKADNMALLHYKCHIKLHEQGLNKKLKKSKQYKEATFMNIIRWRLVNETKEKYGEKIGFTYGYMTRLRRFDLNLEKTHYNDAIAITKEDIKENNITPLKILHVRKKKRSLHEATAVKGTKTPNTTQKRHSKNTKCITYKSKKYCLRDKVKYEGKIGFITGFSLKSHTLLVTDIEGTYFLHKTKKAENKQIPCTNVTVMKRNNNFIYRRYLPKMNMKPVSIKPVIETPEKPMKPRKKRITKEESYLLIPSSYYNA